MICHICRRESRGFGFDPSLLNTFLNDQPALYFCSMKCQERRMIDVTPNEQAAMDNGGRLAGEYLDHLGKTDLAKMTEEEWKMMVECIVTGYIEAMQNFNKIPG